MKVENKYDSNKVVAIKLQQEDINGMLINFDLTDEGKYSYMDDDFIESVMNYLPEYAMGQDLIPSNPVKLIPYLLPYFSKEGLSYGFVSNMAILLTPRLSNI